jgi:hypothetical protein
MKEFAAYELQSQAAKKRPFGILGLYPLSKASVTKRARCSPKSTTSSSECFDTAEVKDAKVLLDELNDQHRVCRRLGVQSAERQFDSAVTRTQPYRR